MGVLEMSSRSCIPFERIVILHLCLSLLYPYVQGGWDNPAFEVDPDGLGGISADGTTITILENVPRVPGGDYGFALLKLKLTDPQDVVVLEQGDDNFNIFSIKEDDDKTSYYFNATRPFDYEKLPIPADELPFIISLKIESSNERQVIRVDVQDVNDNSPRVDHKEPDQIEPIKELVEITDPIVKIFAVDDDVADNGNLIFTILPSAGSDSFEVNNNGEVRLIKKLDYSVRTSHRLHIKISDNREPVRSILENVTVVVLDTPNIPPLFTKLPTTNKVKEELLIDTLIDTIEATDGDYGLGFDIEYDIVDDERKLDLFKIDKTSGEIKVNKRIDAEAEELNGLLSYTFTVIAREKYDGEEFPEFPTLPPEQKESNYNVTFAIEDINDQAPKICTGDDPESCIDKDNYTYSFEIFEDHTGLIPLANGLKIRVVDLDSTTTYNQFKWKLENYDMGDAFSISPDKGVGEMEFAIAVKNAAAIDFDAVNGQWHDGDGNPVERSFTIGFHDINIETIQVRAHIKVKVKDVNDIRPTFVLPDGQTQYEFAICENIESGTPLRNVTVASSSPYPNSCKDFSEGGEIAVFAQDKDVSPSFGNMSIRYRWSKTTRQPPIMLDPENGKMKMDFEGTTGGFDYERFTEEVYIVEAIDSGGSDSGLTESIPVRFKILDRNDETVDLRFTSGYRATINESTTYTGPILTGITATDADESGKISFNMTIVDIFIQDDSFPANSNSTASKYKRVSFADDDNELKEKMRKWFKFVELDPPESSDRRKFFQIELGEELPDREGYGVQEVDRVDLTIRVEDINNQTENQVVSQNVTIIIADINDNPPEWLDGDSNFNVSVSETQWGSEGDTSTERQREIHTLRVIDRDLRTTFSFSLRTDEEDCKKLPEGICDKILNLFELSTTGSTTGTTTLRRRKDQVIDREAREYFVGDSDIINITVAASDGDPEHTLLSKFEVTVEDVNDNTPQFSIAYNETEYNVDENVDPSSNLDIVTILATDKDHPSSFGNVSYLFENGEGNIGIDKFNIHLVNGTITAIPGAYEWYNMNDYPDPRFRLQVKAIDYYRPTSSSGSNQNLMYVYIRVKDKNNHSPEFNIGRDGSMENPHLTLDEANLDTGKELDKFEMVDKDDNSLDNGKFSVTIEDVTKIPTPPENIDLKLLFKLELSPAEDSKNLRNLKISTTQSLHGLWGNYTIKLKATEGPRSDPKRDPSEFEYFLHVKNGNLNFPEFTYPENNDTEIHISILDAKPNVGLIDLKCNCMDPIPNAHAQDKDEGSGPNGEVSYLFDTGETSPSDCMDLFQINSNSGMITLKKELDEIKDANKRCKMVIKASDAGSPPKSSGRILEFILLINKNTPPEFTYHPKTSITILENSTELSSPFEPAIDVDIINGNLYFPGEKIFYFLKGGDFDLFELVEQEENSKIQLYLKAKDVLDREVNDFYKVSIYATNVDTDETEVENKEPDQVLEDGDTQWAVIEVTVCDIPDMPPEFRRTSNEGLVTSGFSVNKKTGDVIGSVYIVDQDCNDSITFNITSDITASEGSNLPPPNQLPLFKLELVPTDPIDDVEDDCTCPKDSSTASANIIINFDPQESYHGYYTFQLTANDSSGLTVKTSCRIYMVASENVLVFYFENTLDELNDEKTKEQLTGILTDTFQYKCNVDRVFANAAYGTTLSVETHFINMDNDEPVNAEYIKAQQFKPIFYQDLHQKLKTAGLNLKQIGESDNVSDADINQIITYVLIGGVAVLTISLLILSATCYYNKKSLRRRVRALTANTFGSQQSGLNRMGLAMEAPNTNAFAVEGSNPIWTTNADPKKVPDFDAESVGSGGSVLIGAEDEDYFKKSSKNPMFQADDVVANYDSENEVGENTSYYDNNAETSDNNYNTYNEKKASEDSPFSSKLTKNPLMNLGDAQMSVDVDDYGEHDDEEYQFETNNDAGLF